MITCKDSRGIHSALHVEVSTPEGLAGISANYAQPADKLVLKYSILKCHALETGYSLEIPSQAGTCIFCDCF